MASTKPKTWIRIQNAASTRVAKAIKRGELTRQPCEVCGDPKVDAHHDDYSKPLDVRWLCRKHHRLHHVSQERSPDICAHGHVLAEVGVYTFPSGRQWCRACKQEAKRRETAKLSAARKQMVAP